MYFSLVPLTLITYVFLFVFDVTEGTSPDDSCLVEELETGMLTFGLNFLAQLNSQNQQEENILVSPLSIYGALALLHLGAEGTTRDELSQALGFQGSDNDVVTFFQTLQNKFQSILATAKSVENTNLAIAAGIFVQNSVKIKSTYLEEVQNCAGTIVENVDFQQDASQATDTINKWISDQTKGKIPQLFPTPLDPSTLIILATTLYFEAKWLHRFQPGANQEGKFYSSAGEVDVTYLSDTRTIPYYKNEALKFEAISLAYENEKFRFCVILPAKESNVQALTQALVAVELQKLFQEIEKKEESVAVKIPKLKFQWNKAVSEVLKALGLKTMFEQAELSRMLEQNVQVSQVTHATTIEVYELGTEATAATVVQLIGSSFQSPTIEFTADRPFVFLIYDAENKTVLFNGIVNKPGMK